MQNGSEDNQPEDNLDAIEGSSTPAALHIQPRNRHFSRADISRHHWVGGHPYASAFFSALSASFPKGEAFFIESLRKFEDRVPPKLQREIRAFIQQEAIHSREHHCFNKHLENSDYDLSRLESNIEGVLNRFRDLPEIQHVTATMCMEHMTAIMAVELISNPAILENVDEEQRNLWLWHGSEEIEHKGVAYDTWLYLTKDWHPLKRYLTRSLFMAKITYGFVKNRTKGMLDLLQQDGITGLRARLGILRYAFLGRAAPGRHTLLPWAHWFKPGFHPWDIDDRELIQLAESEYEAAIMESKPGDDAPTVTELADRLKKIKLPKVA